MAQHNTLGQQGEYAACVYLVERDIHLMERNWRGHSCEIDIIANDYGEIIFIEVKTRSVSRDGQRPEDAVDAYRIERMRRAAQEYLHLKGLTEYPYRFDIIALEGSAPPFNIRHLVNVFPPNRQEPTVPRHPHTL